jgi:hypothetical protein
MARHVDALTAATLKDLREQWWDAEFSEFLQERCGPVRARASSTSDVATARPNWPSAGCASASCGCLRSIATRRAPSRRPQSADRTTTGSARQRPTSRGFRSTSGAFDAVFCVAVLQHVNDVGRAVAELARVTRPEAAS